MHSVHQEKLPSLKVTSSVNPGGLKNQHEKDLKKWTLYVFAVQSLIYEHVCTRLDITHVVGVLGMFQSIQGQIIGKRLRKFWDTSNILKMLCLRFEAVYIVGYVGSDFTGSLDDMKSMSNVENDWWCNFMGKRCRLKLLLSLCRQSLWLVMSLPFRFK